MNDQYNRLRILLKDDLDLLQNSTVAIIGIGGVGSFAIEALARCGIKKLIIIDKDRVDITNINRQLIALHSTVGKYKTDVMKNRILDINPQCEVIALPLFCNKDNLDQIFIHKLDFVIDACDTISVKLALINECVKQNVPFISSMGAANKWDNTRVEICDLSKTYNDSVAKSLRSLVRKSQLNCKIPVVFSSELAYKPNVEINTEISNRKELPLLGSNAFVPSTFGLACANYCCAQLIKNKKDNIT